MLNLGYRFGIRVVIPDSLERVTLAYDKSVGAELVFILKSVEFFRAHICGVETGAGGLVPISAHERLAVYAVPGAIIDFGIFPLRKVGNGLEKILFMSVVLLPVNLVNFISGKTVELQYFLSVVGDSAQVGSGNRNLGIIIHQGGYVALLL